MASKFTRRHYEAIAQVLNKQFTQHPTSDARHLDTLFHTIDSLVDMFEADNPNFDYLKFWNAVRGTGHEIGRRHD